jgi:hypothetical protein
MYIFAIHNNIHYMFTTYTKEDNDWLQQCESEMEREVLYRHTWTIKVWTISIVEDREPTQHPPELMP